MTFELRHYQQDLVDRTRNAIAKGAKGVLVQSPPGSGKSVVIAEIAKLTIENGGHVLFIVHRKELIEQITETFKQHDLNMNEVTINTVIKTRNRLDTIKKPTIIITDETHHSRAKTYREVYDYFPNAFRLGFTATPWRMSGKGFTDIYDTMVSGKSVQWLIDNHSLAPFRYYSVDLSDSEKLKRSSTGDYTYDSMDEALDKAIYGDAVNHYKKLANGQQAILYAHRVQASKDLADVFNENGISAVHADAKTPKREREKIMSDFREGKIKVLCNVDLISEGFDVPDCSVVILLRPTKSLVLHVQQSMRSMRYQPNKEAIIIDHVANYEEHGLPDHDHNWTIKDRFTDKKKQSEKQNSMPVKECPGCFGVVSSKEKICPLCGHEFEVEDNEMEVIDTELKEIGGVAITVNYEKQRWARKSKDELESIEDYVRYADAKGYKKSWVKFQHPELERMAWPKFYQIINKIKL